MSNNPYPVDSPSWREWEKQVGRLEDEPQVDPDDWDLGPACGLDPEVCESCQ